MEVDGREAKIWVSTEERRVDKQADAESLQVAMLAELECLPKGK
jgi:hypothetical protein